MAASGGHHLAYVGDQLAYVTSWKPVFIFSRSYQFKSMSVEEAKFQMMTATSIIWVGKNSSFDKSMCWVEANSQHHRMAMVEKAEPCFGLVDFCKPAQYMSCTIHRFPSNPFLWFVLHIAWILYQVERVVSSWVYSVYSINSSTPVLASKKNKKICLYLFLQNYIEIIICFCIQLYISEYNQ